MTGAGRRVGAPPLPYLVMFVAFGVLLMLVTCVLM